MNNRARHVWLLGGDKVSIGKLGMMGELEGDGGWKEAEGSKWWRAKQGRVCLIGFAGWKDRDPEHSTVLSHSITASGHIMRAHAIRSPQINPSRHTHAHTHTHCRQQSNSLLTHLPVPWFQLNPHHRCNIFFCRFLVPEMEFCSDSRDEGWNDLRDKYSVAQRARLLLRRGSRIIVVTGASRLL